MKRQTSFLLSLVVFFTLYALVLAQSVLDFRGGVHPGPREGCPLCAKLDDFARNNPDGVVITDSSSVWNWRKDVLKHHPDSPPLVLAAVTKHPLPDLTDLNTHPTKVRILTDVPQNN